jgi:hypothetical protein
LPDEKIASSSGEKISVNRPYIVAQPIWSVDESLTVFAAKITPEK